MWTWNCSSAPGPFFPSCTKSGPSHISLTHPSWQLAAVIFYCCFRGWFFSFFPQLHWYIYLTRNIMCLWQLLLWSMYVLQRITIIELVDTSIKSLNYHPSFVARVFRSYSLSFAPDCLGTNVKRTVDSVKVLHVDWLHTEHRQLMACSSGHGFCANQDSSCATHGSKLLSGFCFICLTCQGHASQSRA